MMDEDNAAPRRETLANNDAAYLILLHIIVSGDAGQKSKKKNMVPYNNSVILLMNEVYLPYENNSSIHACKYSVATYPHNIIIEERSTGLEVLNSSL
jgi:hypothetical protein